MRQLTRRNPGRRHGRDEGHRDTVFQKHGRLMTVERPIDDVGESASVTDRVRVGFDMRNI